MLGLSQSELDALSCSQEAYADEPSSPFGSALLARKRHRQRQPEAPSALEASCESIVEVALAGAEFGLSQAVLDELSLQAPEAEDSAPTSPLGTSLRAAKNRRRWGAPAPPPQEKVDVEQAAAPVEPTLRCPASWSNGSTGISQAELDAMCPETDPEPAQEAPTAPSPMKVTVFPASPAHSSQQANPCFSPPMRRRRAGKRADAENAGVKEITSWGFGSPDKAAFGSPGKGMDLTTSPGREILSPQRRSPNWRASPLSPVGLN